MRKFEVGPEVAYPGYGLGRCISVSDQGKTTELLLVPSKNISLAKSTGMLPISIAATIRIQIDKELKTYNLNKLEDMEFLILYSELGII